MPSSVTFTAWPVTFTRVFVTVHAVNVTVHAMNVTDGVVFARLHRVLVTRNSFAASRRANPVTSPLLPLRAPVPAPGSADSCVVVRHPLAIRPLQLPPCGN